MSRPLLTTKLNNPPLRPDLVVRPRLLERLHTGRRCKLTLISAPAGFGKTTLLSKWIHVTAQAEAAPAFAWLSLDKGDNDPARFVAYLIAALQTVENDFGEGTLRLLQSAGFAKVSSPAADTHLPVEELLTALINELADRDENRSSRPTAGSGSTGRVDLGASSPGPAGQSLPARSLVIVLDDYHVIEAQSIHDALTFLLDHLPGHVHLVIATRTDPALPIARLRGQGQVTELRQADLSFTREEAAEFLKQRTDFELSLEDIDALATRTEGWIAGLQMASIAMQSRLVQADVRQAHSPSPAAARREADEISAFVHAFAGSDRFIMDYLLEEVLERQPESIQAFLLQTAILDRLSGPLCDAIVTQRQMVGVPSQNEKPATRLAELPLAHASGQEVLEHLERTNLFVVPLDAQRQWYRYHHLFADLLRRRLERVRPDLVPLLHRRASEWYERNSFSPEAIHHALAASDLDRAAQLIEGAADATWMRSEVATFLGWVEALPADMVRSRPMLSIYHANALLMAGRPLEEVRARLDGVSPAEQEAGSEGTAPVSGGMLVFRALVAAYQGKAAQSAEFSQRALELLPEDCLFLRSLVAGILGLAHMYGGDVETAERALENAVRASQDAGNVMNVVLALCHLAEISMLKGRLGAAKSRYDQALAWAADDQGRLPPIAGIALTGLGQLLLEWNELEAAEGHLLEGIRLASQWGEAGTMRGYHGLASLRQARGDLTGARRALETAQEIAIRFDATEIDDFGVALKLAELSLAEGHPEAAMRWAAERGLDGEASLARVESIGADRQSNDSGPSIVQGYMIALEALTYARLLIALAQSQAAGSKPANQTLDRAVDLLERLQAAMESQGWLWKRIEALVVHALALMARGDSSGALASLSRSLSLAEPEGHMRVFVNEGEPIERLLQQARSRGIAPAYVDRLLAAYTGREADRPVARAPSLSSANLVEPLSEREMEVMQLLTTHLSSTEIANRLFISVNTVRSHIKSIYGKLNAHARDEAVQRAKELNII